MSIEAMKMAFEALERMYADGFEGTCGNAITSLRKAIQEEALRNVQRIGQEIEQEPVLWQWKNTEMVTPFDKTNVEGWTPLYTHPQIEQDWSTQAAALESLREHMLRIKELEEQIEKMKSDKPVAWMDSSGYPKHLRHIQGSEERRLYGELQPLYLHPQPKQEQDEPVSKPTEDMVLSLRGNSGLSTQDAYDALVDVLAVTPLYTHPQPVTTCSGCGESSTKDGFLATYCLKCCEVASGKPLTDEQIETIADKVANMSFIGVVPNFRIRLARAIEAAHGIKEKNDA